MDKSTKKSRFHELLDRAVKSSPKESEKDEEGRTKEVYKRCSISCCIRCGACSFG